MSRKLTRSRHICNTKLKKIKMSYLLIFCDFIPVKIFLRLASADHRFIVNSFVHYTSVYVSLTYIDNMADVVGERYSNIRESSSPPNDKFTITDDILPAININVNIKQLI